MKIQIERIGDSIFAAKDYSNIKDKGEVAHMLCEIESIKLDLLNIWESMEN